MIPVSVIFTIYFDKSACGRQLIIKNTLGVSIVDISTTTISPIIDERVSIVPGRSVRLPCSIVTKPAEVKYL